MEKKECSRLIEKILVKLMPDFPFLSQWNFAFDYAKKRAGVCKLDQKQISISRYHIEHNVEMVVRDTILHELAHAIAYELYHEKGHGPSWQQVALKLGANPKATGKFVLPEYPWAVVTYCSQAETVKKITSRYRRTKNINSYVVKGKPETKGQLYYLSTEELNQFESGLIKFSELTFIQ